MPRRTSPGEIYQALEKGTIDAAEWVGPYDDEKLASTRSPNLSYPGWWEGGAALHFFFGTNKWDSLPPNYKSIVESGPQ